VTESKFIIPLPAHPFAGHNRRLHSLQRRQAAVHVPKRQRNVGASPRKSVRETGGGLQQAGRGSASVGPRNDDGRQGGPLQRGRERFGEVAKVDLGAPGRRHQLAEVRAAPGAGGSVLHPRLFRHFGGLLRPGSQLDGVCCCLDISIMCLEQLS